MRVALRTCVRLTPPVRLSGTVRILPTRRRLTMNMTAPARDKPPEHVCKPYRLTRARTKYVIAFR